MNYYLEGNEEKPKQQKEKQLNTNQVIYLGELPPDLDQYELNQFILSQGKFTIESLLVKKAVGNKSFAYVKFKNRTEAERARRALHLKPFKDYVIKAEPFKQNDKNDKTKNEANLFIKNLPLETTPKDLYDLFNSYGSIISIKLKQNDKGECLGYGYVNYDSEQSALDAIESLNDKEYKGKVISVSIFTPREKRMESNEYANPLLLVKNLQNDIEDEKQLQSMFDVYGQIILCGIINELQNNKTGVLVFAKKENAESAIAGQNHKPLPGSTYPVELSLTPFDQDLIEKIKKSKQESYKLKFEGCNLVVKNLPIEIGDKLLFDLFRPFGDISSARVATEGIMKEIKNNEGEVIDKEFVYQSKGYAFVLFKNSDSAQKAKNSLNDKEGEIKGVKYKILIDYYDYSKGEKSKINEIQMNMNQKQITQKPQRQIIDKSYKNNNNNPNYLNNRSYHQNNQNRQPNRFDNSNDMQKMNMGNKGNQNQIDQHHQYHQHPQRQQFSQQQQQHYQQQQHQQQQHQHQQQQYNQNLVAEEPKITVEGSNLVGKVVQILSIENEDERTESLGELLFYFLLKFIPQYELNMTNGKVEDTALCSKLTGILIKTDTKNLLEIISKTDRLCNSLRDVLLVSCHFLFFIRN